LESGLATVIPSPDEEFLPPPQMIPPQVLNLLFRGHISARVLTRTWAEGEASDIQAPFAGISYVVFGSWDLGKPLLSQHNENKYEKCLENNISHKVRQSSVPTAQQA